MSVVTGSPTTYDESHPELSWNERYNMQLMDQHVERTGNCGVRGYCPTSIFTARQIDREIAEEERRMWAPKKKRDHKRRL